MGPPCTPSPSPTEHLACPCGHGLRLPECWAIGSGWVETGGALGRSRPRARGLGRPSGTSPTVSRLLPPPWLLLDGEVLIDAAEFESGLITLVRTAQGEWRLIRYNRENGARMNAITWTPEAPESLGPDGKGWLVAWMGEPAALEADGRMRHWFTEMNGTTGLSTIPLNGEGNVNQAGMLEDGRCWVSRSQARLITDDTEGQWMSNGRSPSDSPWTGPMASFGCCTTTPVAQHGNGPRWTTRRWPHGPRMRSRSPARPRMGPSRTTAQGHLENLRTFSSIPSLDFFHLLLCRICSSSPRTTRTSTSPSA